MCVCLCHCCFHGTKGVIVYPPSCHLVDFRYPACDCSRHFPTGQFFQSALELLHRFLMWSALPPFCLTVLVKAKTRIFHNDYIPNWPFDPSIMTLLVQRCLNNSEKQCLIFVQCCTSKLSRLENRNRCVDSLTSSQLLERIGKASDQFEQPFIIPCHLLMWDKEVKEV